MARPAVASLDALRARIREIEGVRVRTQRTPSGVHAVDTLIGGLPTPGIVEICGPLGSGRTHLALELVHAALTQRKQVAWVDYEHLLYAPALEALGLPLHRLYRTLRAHFADLLEAYWSSHR